MPLPEVLRHHSGPATGPAEVSRTGRSSHYPLRKRLIALAAQLAVGSAAYGPLRLPAQDFAVEHPMIHVRRVSHTPWYTYYL